MLDKILSKMSKVLNVGLIPDPEDNDAVWLQVGGRRMIFRYGKLKGYYTP